MAGRARRARTHACDRPLVLHRPVGRTTRIRARGDLVPRQAGPLPGAEGPRGGDLPFLARAVGGDAEAAGRGGAPALSRGSLPVRITIVRPSWLRAMIPADRAHVSDFGKNDSFNTCLVEIETDTGLVGLGEAKVAVGNLGHYAAIVTLIRDELAPALVGRDPRDVTGIWELLYSGSRAHYALRE